MSIMSVHGCISCPKCRDLHCPMCTDCKKQEPLRTFDQDYMDRVVEAKDAEIARLKELIKYHEENYDSLRATLTKDFDKQREKTVSAYSLLSECREGLEKIIAYAGNPDAAEGCRIIIKEVRSLLQKMGEMK